MNCGYIFEDIDFCFFAKFLPLAQLTSIFSDPFDLTPRQGGKSGVTHLKIGFWRLLLFEDIDFWVFAMFLTLAQLTFMFSEPFDLTRSSKGGKLGVTPLKIGLWKIAAMLLKISTSVFVAKFLT